MENFSLESIKALTKKKSNNAVKNFKYIQQRIEEAAEEGKRYCMYMCDDDTFNYAYNKLMDMGFNVEDLSEKYPARNPEYKSLGIDW